MKRFLSILLVLFVTLSLAGQPLPAYTQSVTEQSRRDSISVSADPNYPEPGENVEFTTSSFLVSLDGAQIQWNINGEAVAGGPGKKQVSYTMPEDGSNANIQLQVNPVGKNPITKEFVIRPTTIDLIWEANSYTPPFYEGKSLYPGVGKITVTAKPFINKQNGGQYNKENLVYEWSYNGLTHGSDSGLGETTFTVDVNRANNQVSVVISNRAGNKIGEAQQSIPTQEPDLLLYPKTPERGVVLAQPLKEEDNQLNRDDTVVSYPYFYPIEPSNDSNFSYQWYIDSERINNNGSGLSFANISNNEFTLSAGLESDNFIFPSIRTNAVISL